MKNKLELIEFWASWCSPCKYMKEYLLKFEPIYSDDYTFKYIQLDDPSITPEILNNYKSEYGFSSIPFIVIKKNGIVVDKHTGMITKNLLKEFLDNNI